MPAKKPKAGEEYLGIGLVGPLVEGPSGDFVAEAGKNLIGAALQAILSTKASFRSDSMYAAGERFMRSNFGCKAYTVRHENLDDATVALVESHYVEAIELWEPRVTITNVQSKIIGEGIQTKLDTKVKGTNEQVNLTIFRNSRGQVSFDKFKE